MNKIRFGNSEIAITLWIFSVFLIVFTFMYPFPLVIQLLLLFSMFLSGAAVLWLPLLINKYQLRPTIDKCGKEETTWCRCTLDRILIPQFVSKGPYGQTKGVTYKEKADVIDDGEFPCKWLNGNPAIIMYDGMNTSIDLRKSIARKQMTKKYGVRSGIEAYNLAKEKGALLHDKE